MESLFVMDPLDRIQVAGDSTYMLMRECSDRAYPVFSCVPDDLYALNGQAFAWATPVVTTERAPYFEAGEPTSRALTDFDVVWMRKDPPFDMRYIFATYLLDLATPETLVLNDPMGLKCYNEKIWAMRWAQFHPPTLLSNDMDRLAAFVEEQSGGAVLKPWDGNGGRGVLVTARGDRNLRSMIELLTANGRDNVIAQGFLEGVRRGDKRILLFDGDVAGAILRIPSSKDHRANMHVGASVVACDLSERDVEICRALGPELKALGMMFVGIDVIDGYLTEINVTSPTGIREVNALYGRKLEADLIDRVERQVAARQGHHQRFGQSPRRT